MLDKPPHRTNSGPAHRTPARVDTLESAAAFQIRPIESLADFRACVVIQEEVWGRGFIDIVCASVLQVTSHIGGIVVGAFSPTGELVGFVAGFTGLEDGRLVHWSHMLGVRETARNAGVGRALKEHQRAELARMGIPEMRWSFDPLVAKNAHFNLNRLGARAIRYVRDMYGDTGSALHGTITDRLIVACPTDAADAEAAASFEIEASVPILTCAPQEGDLILAGDSSRPPSVWIEVPSDIVSVMKESPDAAASWRLAVRRSFEWALERGYVATGFHRDAVSSRAFYVLKLGEARP